MTLTKDKSIARINSHVMIMILPWHSIIYILEYHFDVKPSTVVASGTMSLTNYKEWLNEIESKLESTRVTGSDDVVVVLRSVLNIPQKLTSTTYYT